MDTTTRVPRLAQKVLRWYCNPLLAEEIEGDLEEYYLLHLEKYPAWRAKLTYWYYMLGFVRPYTFKKTQISNQWIMINNYLKFSVRYLSKHWPTSLFNIGSLSIGITCFLFIFIYLSGERSFDQHFEDAHLVRRVVKDFVFEGDRTPDATTPPALAPALLSDLPEVDLATRLFPPWGRKYLIGTNRDHQYFEEGVYRVDPAFLEIFSFTVVDGPKKALLVNPHEVVITQSTAAKYFGDTSPIGKELTVFNDGNRKLIVSAVIEDVPLNSHFNFDFLIPLHFADRNIDEMWGWYNYYTYVKLQRGADHEAFEEKLQPLYLKYNPRDSVDANIFYSQALADIHLSSNLKWELGANGNMNNVRIFEAVGIFILLISLINYLNLTLAGLTKRTKEVSVRKSFGAQKANLIWQFAVEAIIVTTCSLIISAFLTEATLRQMEVFFGRPISLLDQPYLDTFLWLSIIVIATGIAIGLYPAFRFSRMGDLRSTNTRNPQQGFDLKKGLLIVQFSISVIMIISTLIVYQQLVYFQEADMGFDMDQVLVVENAREVANQEVLISRINQLPFVESASLSNGVLGGINWTFTVGYPQGILMNYAAISPEYVETLDIKITTGRNFDRSIETDGQGMTMLVNEVGLEALNLSYEQVGQSVVLDSEEDSLIYGKVIGVVKDFHFTSFKSEIKPYAFFYREEPMTNLTVKLSTSNLSDNIRELEMIWNELSGGSPMESYFLDQSFQQLHENEERLAQVLLYLTVLSIFIAFTGMLGIVNLVIKDRLNEIAVRKVLGAHTGQLVGLLSKNFVILVFISNVIGIPIAYYVMDLWVSDFSYRIELTPLTFIIASTSTIILAIAITGIRSFQASNTHLTNYLREK